MGRYFITSALPYINGVKHLGNLIGSMLPADVHARFRRLQGHEVLFVCATDEHGTPAELAALEAGQSVRDYCDDQHLLQAKVCERFGLSFDVFGRTSSRQNHQLTLQFATRLYEAGFLECRETNQMYSRADNRFLPDRYVEGTCPVCASANARGDQCEACGTQLDPGDLIAPRSAISGSTDLETRTTRHFHLLQSKLENRIAMWLRTKDGWPLLTRSIAHKWLKEGLKDRSITRDLSWGVPVRINDRIPEGFESKVFYVWFDAPIGYIGATVEWSERTGGDWRRWWRNDQGAADAVHVQFMGKDNVGFHTVGFPATLIGSGEPWHLVDRLKSFNWLAYDGGKFSTSRRRGIFMDAALDIAPADVWRWSLVSYAPETDDTNFSLDLLRTTTNAELADGLGNFATRLTRFSASAFDGLIPEETKDDVSVFELAREVEDAFAGITYAHENLEFRAAARATRRLWDIGNRFLARQSPWQKIAKDRSAAVSSTRAALGLMRLISIAARPIIPTLARELETAFIDMKPIETWPTRASEFILGADRPRGNVLTVAPPVNKITLDDVETWRPRFAGETGL